MIVKKAGRRVAGGGGGRMRGRGSESHGKGHTDKWKCLISQLGW